MDERRKAAAVVEADPLNGSAWLELGHLLARDREAERARECFERAVSLDPMLADEAQRALQLLDLPDWIRGEAQRTTDEMEDWEEDESADEGKEEDGPSAAAYRLAALALFINSLLTFASTLQTGDSRNYAQVAIDILLIIGLLRLRSGARIWTLVRVALAAVILPFLYFATDEPIIAGLLSSVQLVYAIGLALLLVGRPRTVRLVFASILLALVFGVGSLGLLGGEPEGPTLSERVMQLSGIPTPTPEWHTYTSSRGKFRITMPGVPTESSERIATEVGDLDAWLVFLENERSEGYGIVYIDYPEVILKADPSSVLDGAVNGQVSDVGGQVVSTRGTSLEGYPGREVIFSLPGSATLGSAIGKSRVYLVHQRLYFILAVFPTSKLPAEADRFLDSFQLLP